MFMAVAVRRPTDREEGAGYRIGPRPSMRAVRGGGQPLGIGSACVAICPALTDRQECLAAHVRVRMVGCTISTLTFCLCVRVNVVAAGGVDDGRGFGTANGWTIIYTI